MSMTYPTLLIKFFTYPKKFESDLLYSVPYMFWYFVHFPSKFLYIYWFCKRSDFSFFLCLTQGPVAGYRSVLRTFISAFIASYEINLQVTIYGYLQVVCKEFTEYFF